MKLVMWPKLKLVTKLTKITYSFRVHENIRKNIVYANNYYILLLLLLIFKNRLYNSKIYFKKILWRTQPSQIQKKIHILLKKVAWCHLFKLCRCHWHLIFKYKILFTIKNLFLFYFSRAWLKINYFKIYNIRFN